MTKYVYSTLASAVEYPTYVAGGGDIPVNAGSIVIQGGANIPDKFMRTPEGAVVTPVTDADADTLMLSPVFLLHMENGFIDVRDKETTGEKAAADMQGRDTSAPLIDRDFEAEGKEPPKTGKVDDEDKPAATKTSGRRA